MADDTQAAISSFTDVLGSDAYPLEAGRYWLFIAKVCPFAHRTEITRRLAGLDGMIGLTVAASVQDERGWDLRRCYEGPGVSPNPLSDVQMLSDLYRLAAADYAGVESVPVLFDLHTQRIVNNESAEIIRQFDALAVQRGQHDSLYPAEDRTRIDALIDKLGGELIGPIYDAGLAEDQQTYQTNVERVFETLAFLERHLADAGRYLLGDRLTLADVHAYPHLARFDAIYHSLYRLNLAYLRDYPNIAAYMGRLADVPAIAETLDIEAAKAGYFLSANQPCNRCFVPAGPAVDPRSGLALPSGPVG